LSGFARPALILLRAAEAIRTASLLQRHSDNPSSDTREPDMTDTPDYMRGRMVNRVSGPPEGQLPERHDASDFATKTG